MSIKRALTLKYNKTEKKLAIIGYEEEVLAKEVLKAANALDKKIDENEDFVQKITEINQEQKIDATSVNLLTETLCFLYELENELS